RGIFPALRSCCTENVEWNVVLHLDILTKDWVISDEVSLLAFVAGNDHYKCQALSKCFPEGSVVCAKPDYRKRLLPGSPRSLRSEVGLMEQSGADGMHVIAEPHGAVCRAIVVLQLPIVEIGPTGA